MDYKGIDNDRNKVNVLTAGGVASKTPSPASRKSKKRNKKKQTLSPPNDNHNDSVAVAVAVGTPHATATVSAPTSESAIATASTCTPANDMKQEAQNPPPNHHEAPVMSLELEESDQQEPDDWDNAPLAAQPENDSPLHSPYTDDPKLSSFPNPNAHAVQLEMEKHTKHELIWLTICFLGIMASFVCYGLLMEYTTSGGRELHELSFLFITSGLYTITAATGRYVRDETPTTIPPARFAILGLTSMGSTFCSVRSLRYVIYPIQVLAKSCKPVPVMLMGALMGKTYPARKYMNVVLIVLGVALFMGAGDDTKKSTVHVVDTAASTVDDTAVDGEATAASPSQIIGIVLLFISLCFDGGTGAYEDKLMSVHSVQPFDLMYNIQLGKTILAGIGLLVLNQLHIFIQMVQEMGFLLVALGLSGALGQVFIFVTIAKFGALTCSIIGLSRKVTTLVASIYFYGHRLNSLQFTGLMISITAMVMNFWGKKKGGDGHHGAPPAVVPEEMEKMLDDEPIDDDDNGGDVELAPVHKLV